MRFTLWAEGPSDVCLIPILIWLLRECGVSDDIETDENFIFRPKHHREYNSLTKIFSDEDYWSDLLFVHIDADSDEETRGKGPQERGRQCQEKVAEVEKALNLPPHLCVIPVQETETWLLVSEAAIRRVTGNSKKSIGLPGRARLEDIGNPKRRLCGILRALDISVPEDEADTEIWKSLAGCISVTEPQGYGILRGIPSFDRLEATMRLMVERQGLTQR